MGAQKSTTVLLIGNTQLAPREKAILVSLGLPQDTGPEETNKVRAQVTNAGSAGLPHVTCMGPYEESMNTETSKRKFEYMYFPGKRVFPFSQT